MRSSTEPGVREKLPKPDARLVRSVSDLSLSPAFQQCAAHFQRNRQWINERHLELARIPSPTFFEEKRAEWMAAQFRALGWDAKLDRAGNVIAHEEGDRENEYVALTAHLDTVLAPRKEDEIQSGPDGRLHGPGVADNGAGLAALLAIACAWKQDPAMRKPDKTGLVLVANVGEEGEGNLSGMRFLCKQSPLAGKIRSFLVLDGPGTEHITCRALASRRFEVIVSGPGGHSWGDHGVANPVHALSRAIHYFTEMQQTGGLSTGPRTSYNFGLVEGGVSVNSIPSSARAKLDVRSEDAVRIDDMARELRDCVEQALEVENSRAIGGKISVRIREIGARPGGVLPEHSRMVPYLRAVDSHLRIRSFLDCASTDANIPLSMGLDAVSIGAGGHGGGAHTPEEWFDAEGRELGLQRVMLALCLLLAA